MHLLFSRHFRVHDIAADRLTMETTRVKTAHCPKTGLLTVSAQNLDNLVFEVTSIVFGYHSLLYGFFNKTFCVVGKG